MISSSCSHFGINFPDFNENAENRASHIRSVCAVWKRHLVNARNRVCEPGVTLFFNKLQRFINKSVWWRWCKTSSKGELAVRAREPATAGAGVWRAVSSTFVSTHSSGEGQSLMLHYWAISSSLSDQVSDTKDLDRAMPWYSLERLLEKHSYSSQMFLPLSCHGSMSEENAKDKCGYLVVVAPCLSDDASTPDLSRLRVFYSDLKLRVQGINYKPNTWHHPMIVLGQRIGFTNLTWERQAAALDAGEDTTEWFLPEGISLFVDPWACCSVKKYSSSQRMDESQWNKWIKWMPLIWALPRCERKENKRRDGRQGTQWPGGHSGNEQNGILCKFQRVVCCKVYEGCPGTHRSPSSSKRPSRRPGKSRSRCFCSQCLWDVWLMSVCETGGWRVQHWKGQTRASRDCCHWGVLWEEDEAGRNPTQNVHKLP